MSQCNILLVDDEAFVRQWTRRLLAELGCVDLREACNGREALAALDAPNANIDLILCDLMMPDMDGIEIVRHLAARPEPPAIAFLSGAESSLLRAAESLARAYSLRGVGSIAKPVAKDKLQSVIADATREATPKAQRARLLIGEYDLARGIAAGELCLHYQPKVSIKTRRLESVESLVRWNHPSLGLLPPDSFVPVAEATGLITPMTEQLIEISFRQMADWKHHGLAPHVAINLSPSMLSDVSLPDRAAKLAAGLSLDPEHIVFEITETGVAKEENIYLEIVTRLHMKGFALSIDDFGTGSSSLKKLEALPFTELKVDRQFVDGAHKNPAKSAILQASLTLAKSLGMKTVAEGVEDKADWDLLQTLPCDLVQGYFVARPMTSGALPAWVETWGA